MTDKKQNSNQKNQILTKEERFKKYAEMRTQKVIKGLKQLSNCSNKNNYLYTLEQVEQIFIAINKGVSSCKQSFSDQKVDEDVFKLS